MTPPRARSRRAASRRAQHEREERRAEERRDDADRDLRRRERRPRDHVREHEEPRARRRPTAGAARGSSTPASSRIVCGTMIPTKPISPVTATAAAVPSVAATTSASRTRRTSTPEARRLVVAEVEDVHDAAAARGSRRRATATYGRIRTTSRPARARDVPEDPRVDLLQRLGVLLLDERLPGGEERRDRHAGEDERRRVALAPRRAADRVREHDRDRAADERRDREQPLAAKAVGQVRDRDRRAEPGAGGDAEQVRDRRAGCGRRPGTSRRRARASRRRARRARRAAPGSPRGSPPRSARATSRSRERGDARAADSSTAPTPRSTGPASTPTTSDSSEERDGGARPDRGQPASPDVGGVLRDGRHRATGAAARAPTTSRGRSSTSRGPQREAIESSIRTIEPVRTALIRSQPGRAATVDAFWPQHTVSARTIDVGARRDDVLGRELRVAEAGRVGGVGDVLQPEQRVHLPDERLRRRRVEVGRRARGRR